MKVIIIGGGAAGMMAAYQAAKCGNDVSLYEKNEKLGKKIFITGKGRCNVTNACEIEELLDHVVTNKEFLYSGFYSFTNDAMMELLEELGCPLKVERGNRVFPVSDHSSDIIAALQRGLRKENVDIYFNTTVKKILIEDGIVTGVRLASGDTVKADKVVVATGGMSYQATGSTGDGYDFARKAGHKVTKLTPALVPFEIKEDYCKQLMGLSLRNVAVIMTADGKKISCLQIGAAFTVCFPMRIFILTLPGCTPPIPVLIVWKMPCRFIRVHRWRSCAHFWKFQPRALKRN